MVCLVRDAKTPQPVGGRMRGGGFDPKGIVYLTEPNIIARRKALPGSSGAASSLSGRSEPVGISTGEDIAP